MNNNKQKLTGFLRQREILELLKISKSKWNRGVVSGIYPRGNKIGTRTRVWSITSIQKLIQEIEEGKHEKQ